MEKVQKPKKIFNPQTMVRYDEVVVNDKKSVWVCKLCLTVLLSPVRAVTHHATCKLSPTKKSTRIKNKNIINIRAAETVEKAEAIQAAAKIQVAKKTRVTKRVQLTKKNQMALKTPKVEMALKNPKVEMALKNPKVEIDDSTPPYICLCCNYMFGRKVALQQHLRHKQIKEFMSDEEEDDF